MPDTQYERQRLEASIERRTALLASHVRPGDRIAAFVDLWERVRTDPALAQEFAALRQERRELEKLNGIEEKGVNQISDKFDDLDDDLIESFYDSKEEADRVRNSPAYHAWHHAIENGEYADPQDYDEQWFEETKTHAYRRAVLTALVEARGPAHYESILPRVEQIMRPHLTEHDYEPVKSYPDQPLWYNRACRTRQELVAAGLMKDDSPESIWEISDAGRTALVHGDY